jgi:ABC-2 type transport system ATP-binding protein
MNLITAKSLTKIFRGRQVVKGVDLEVEQGQVLALIGPNGAGKSTTLSMLLGILKPDSGSVAYWRDDYRAHIGVQLQSTPFFEGYTAEENLKLFAALYRIKLDEAQLQEKLEECRLTEAKKVPAVRLSIGQQKQLALAVTTVHQPDLIVLDEPTAGLDPRARHDIRQTIRSFADGGRTVVFSSHDMEEVERVADRLVFISEGQIVAQGQPEALLQEYYLNDLEELYLKLTESEERVGA